MMFGHDCCGGGACNYEPPIYWVTVWLTLSIELRPKDLDHLKKLFNVIEKITEQTIAVKPSINKNIVDINFVSSNQLDAPPLGKVFVNSKQYELESHTDLGGYIGYDLRRTEYESVSTIPELRSLLKEYKQKQYKSKITIGDVHG